MRRISPLVIVLVCATIATSSTMDVVAAKERATLSSVVGRLFNFKKTKPVEAEAPPAAAQPRTQRVARTQPSSDTPPPHGAVQQQPPQQQMTRLPVAKSNTTPYPPLPPTIDLAWIHPPDPAATHSYTTDEVLAMTRAAGSSRRQRSTATAPANAIASSPITSNPVTNNPVTSNPVASNSMAENSVAKRLVPEDATTKQPLVASTVGDTAVASNPVANGKDIASTSSRGRSSRNSAFQVRQVSHVTESNSRPKSSSQPALVGNTPQAVGGFEESAASGGTSRRTDTEDSDQGQAKTVKQKEGPASTRELPPVFQKVRGQIASIDPESGIIRVDLSEQETLPANTKIRVYHESESGELVSAHLRVLDSAAGVAAAKLVEGESVPLAPGDRTVAWKAGTTQ